MDLSTDDLLDRVRKIDALNAHLTFRLSRLAKLLEIEGAQRISGSGVNLTGYRMMLVIDIFGEITVSDLGKVMLIDRAQISRAGAELIERGLMEARESPTSRRKKLLALTDEGAALYRDLRARFDTRETALSDTAGKDLDALWRSVDGMSDWLDAKTRAG
ncbi:MAG: MarR family transcriptional regulator [Pseudomonadota bacterium]